MILPRVAGEGKGEFVEQMVAILVQQGCVGLSEEEIKKFKAKIVAIVKKAQPAEASDTTNMDMSSMTKG